MEKEKLNCSVITIGDSSYEIGGFIGEEQIKAIAVEQHDDRGGIDATLMLGEGAQISFIHRGPYTLLFVSV